MDSLSGNSILGLPVTQNKQEFVIGVFTIEKIRKFTRYTERLIVNYDENNQPVYNDEVQRKVEPDRVGKIAQFLIDDPNATFPTNLVISIPNEVINSQKMKGNFMEIELNDRVFEEVNKNKGDIYLTIIDGQHRIKGIEEAIIILQKDIKIAEQTLRGGASEKIQKKLKKNRERLNDLLKIELVVSFFIGKTLEYQAMIFSTINRTQKRVSQNLVYSLFGLTTSDSPQKTALQIVLALNGHKMSPFYKRIKLYGGDYERYMSPPLSQATMVKSIIDLISENIKESESDRFRDRAELNKRSPGSSKILPFRKHYALNKDINISNYLYFYFKAVKEVFINDAGNSFWDLSSNTNILQTTVGYQALLKILVDIIENEEITNIASVEEYSKHLINASTINFADGKRYPFANKSKNILYYDISLAIWAHDPSNPKDNRMVLLEKALRKNEER